MYIQVSANILNHDSLVLSSDGTFDFPWSDAYVNFFLLAGVKQSITVINKAIKSHGDCLSGPKLARV